MAMEVSAGGVLFDDNEIFVLRKPNREWVMPKGHVEPGETPEQAAVREVFEETGIEAKIIAKVGKTAYEFRAPDGEIVHKTVHWYLMSTGGRELRVEPTFEEGVFLPVEVALRTLTFENDREIVRRALRKHQQLAAKKRPISRKRG